MYISNVLGAIAPVQEISEAAHKVCGRLKCNPDNPATICGLCGFYLRLQRGWNCYARFAICLKALHKKVHTLMGSYFHADKEQRRLPGGGKWQPHASSDLRVSSSWVSTCVQVGAKVLFDSSQAVPAMPVDVQSMGADFIAATAHKLCGPTGIGLLWGRHVSFFRILLQGMCTPHGAEYLARPQKSPERDSPAHGLMGMWSSRGTNCVCKHSSQRCPSEKG